MWSLHTKGWWLINPRGEWDTVMNILVLEVS